MFFKLKFIIPMAVVMSASATFGIYRYLEKQKDKIQQPEIGHVQVVLARTDLPLGEKLKSTDLVVVDWPENLKPKGSFADMSEIVDRVIKTAVYEGETIIESKLAPSGSEGGFPAVIPPGMRALTVSVNTQTGVSGFLLPNTRVDVLVTVPSSVNKRYSTTKIILEDIKVLAVDQTYERKGDEPVAVQSVTLLVTPRQAEKLALACTEGKLQLSLRNTSDRTVQPTSGVRLSELITRRTYTPTVTKKPVEKKQAPVEPEITERVVEVIRSGERSNVKFEEKRSDPKKKDVKKSKQ